jgi:hemolysin D
MIDGAVLRISPDAADPPELRTTRDTASREEMPAASYRTLIALERSSLDGTEPTQKLAAGMKVNAEIHLGTRSVLEYLLSPIAPVAHEAMRER